MKRKQSILSVIITAIVFVTTVLLCQAQAKSSHPLTAFMNVPLTGPISFPTKSFQEAALFAIDDIKTKGHSANFSFHWNDNQAKPSTAVTIAQSPQTKNADLFYVGYGTELDAALPALAENQSPIFAFSFQISSTDHPLVFRNIVSYRNEAPKFVEYAKFRGAKKIVCIFHDLPDTHEEFQGIVQPGLVRSGSDVVLITHSLVNPDFRTIAEKAKSENPDLIIISGFQQNLLPLIDSLRTTGLINNGGNVIGTFAVLDLLALTSPEVLEGIAVAIPEFMLNPSSKAREFRENFSTKFGRRASFNEFCAYDFVLLMDDLSKRLPQGATPKQVLQAVKETDFDGMSGRIHFNANGDVLYPTRIAMFRKGELVSVDNK